MLSYVIHGLLMPLHVCVPVPMLMHDHAVRFSAKPIQSVFQLGEPIWIDLEFVNKGRDRFLVNICDDAGIGLTWKKPLDSEAMPIKPSKAARGGLFVPQTLSVAAGESGTHRVLLNKWLVPEEAGTFELQVDVNWETKLQARAITTVKLEPPTEKGRKVLHERLKEWYATTPGIDHKEGKYALDSLVYTRSLEAIVYQHGILDRISSGHELAPCLESMLAGSPDESVRIFVRRLEEPNSNKNVRSGILFALKSYGWDKLSPSSKKLLGSFKTEIEQAVPIRPGD